MQLEYESEWNNHRTKRKVLAEQIKTVEAKIKHVQHQLASLEVKSPADGRVVIPRSEDLPGRYKRKGELLGYVVNEKELVSRVLVPQQEMGLIDSTQAVTLRPIHSMDAVYETRILRIIPSATDQLPNAALGKQGGGAIKVDPKDPKGIRALEKYFEVWVALPPALAGVFPGTRTYVRFNHGNEVLATRVHRWLKQLFVGRINV